MARFVDARTRVLQEESTKAVIANSSDPTVDMDAERGRATFDVGELLCYLNGGREKVERKEHFAELLARTDWGSKSERYFMTREEQYIHGLKAAFGIWDLMKEHRFSIGDGRVLRDLINFPGGLELHIGMFIPSLVSHADPDQQAKWLPMAQRLEIIGTYAQTELGHGTFVRGLETTATYDPDSQEFITHSPTLTSTKWWPGGLGKTATHIILLARLFIRGKDYGPHAFVVQIRTLKDHKPMPGITIGDIGPKFGINGVDNGFLRLEYVRIPRENMLMRFAKVTSQGEYIPPPPANSKASYATMLFVRATIVTDSGKFLSMATTIAVRYCAVRRQTAPTGLEKETQVLDYQSVAGTLLPLLASAYALHFTGKVMMGMYTDFEKHRDQGDFRVLPELHAVSSGLKALCTWMTSEGIEKCRRLCGGHGYSRLSGLPDLFSSYVQNVTWEGDNNVLCLQTGRFLIKSLMGAMMGTTVGGAAKYLENIKAELGQRCPVVNASHWLDQMVQLAAFRNRAAHLCVDALEQLKHESGSNPVFEGGPWDSCNVIVIRLAVAHCQYVIYKNFMDSIQGIESHHHLPPATCRVLRDLLSLFALTCVEKEVADFLESGYISAKQLKLLREQQRALLNRVRVNAVGLVDAFGFLDYELNSAIGRADGDVYRGLLEMAQGSPLNRTEEGPGWEAVLKHRMTRRSKL